MLDKDVVLMIFYIVYDAQDRRGGKVLFFARATIIWNFLQYFETLNIKIMSSITQKENLTRYNLFES